MPTGQVGESLGEVFTAVCGQACSWSPECSQQEWCSLNADILICFSPALPPAPVMGLSLQSSGRERRLCSSALHSWRDGHSLTAFLAGEIPGVPYLSAVRPWGCGDTDKVPLGHSIVSKLV